VLFAITWSLQRPGYIQGTVKTSAWIVAIAAELVLAVGGSGSGRPGRLGATGMLKI
jgi:hypothetical protein